MTQIAALPTIKVEIAFNPTNLVTTPGTWTDVSAYVRAYDVQAGRQHYLDRVQSGQLRLTVNNRTGFFLNGTTNGTGYVIQPRCLVRITATYSGTTYSVFYGLIDSIQESVQDQVNADLTITASDFLKYLSLKYANNPTLYPSYAQVASTQNYYRLGGASPAVVTQATANGTTETYICNNSFVAGQKVSIFGLTTSTGASSPLNQELVTVATASATQFTTTTGLSSATAYNQNGVVYLAQYTDLVGGTNVTTYHGQMSFPANGAMVYDPQNCVDASNGSSNGSGFVTVNANIGAAGTSYGVDFWVLGLSLYSLSATNQTILGGTWDGTNYCVLGVDQQGFIYINDNTTTKVYIKDVAGNKIQVADGYWHHVGFHYIGTTLYGYCDGNFTAVSSPSWTAFKSGYFLAAFPSVTPYSQAAGLFQDVCVVGSTITQNDVLNRFKAGGLLSTGQPVTANAVYSGDRIAEALVVAGYASISAGAISGLGSLYSVNGVSYPAPTPTGNGFINVEPYYWDSPVYNSTVLDIIQQVTDTDLGAFYQKRDGTFVFYTQSYYGSWSWNGTTGTWTPNTYTPTGAKYWSDDDSSPYSYEAPSLQIYRDDADLWTIVSVTPQSGTAQVYDSGNEARWGFSTLSKSGTLHPSLSLALSSANYLGYLYRSPLPRVQNVELRNTSHNGGALPAILGTSFGDVVRFVRNAPNSLNATATSSTSNSIGTGSKTFTVASGLWFVAGQTVTATSGANSMTGTVTSYSGTTLVLNITSTVGSGTFTSWTITGAYPSVMGVIDTNMVVEAITESFQAEPGTYIATFVLDPYPVRS